MKRGQLNKIHNAVGFTLIEVVATIAVIGILVLISVPLVGNVMSSSEDKAKESAIDLIETAGAMADSGDIPLDYTSTEAYSVQTLVNAGLVKPSSPFTELFEGNNVVKRVGEDEYEFEYNTEISDFTWEHVEGDSGPVMITGYIGTAKDITIPREIEGQPVTHISDYAFSEVDELVAYAAEQQARIDAIKAENGEDASAHIDALLEELRYVVDLLNQSMTVDPNGLVSVSIPNTVVSIGEGSFYRNNLKTVNLPESLEYIGANAFQTNRISDIKIPSSLTELSAGVFMNNKLDSIIIPDTITSVGSLAFGMNQLEDVTISKNMSEISTSMFANNNISEIVIPDNIVSIGDGAFWHNDLTDVPKAKNVTRIEAQTYLGNVKMSNITIPDGIEYIGENAFSMGDGVLGIDSVSLPDSLTHIGEYAFRGNQLRTVHVPDSVISMDRGAFYDNIITDLKLSKNLVNIPESAFAVGNHERTLHEDIDSLYIDRLVIPEGVESIGTRAFSNQRINEVRFPSTLTSIGNHAFNDSNMSGSLVIPEGVTTIGDSAFRMHNLTNVSFPSTLESIGSWGFYVGNINLKSVVLSDTVKLGNYAFNGSTQVNGVLFRNR